MDTSEQYIKMCEKAEEIQASRKFECGDCMVTGDNLIMIRRLSDEGDYFLASLLPRGHNFLLISNKNVIWLPRQDQLQEMVIDADYAMSYLTRIMDWAGITLAKYLLQFTSMEQLWLAFVMKEKYGKVWDGEKWTSC
uniref:Uncharacterized protein n=1 Tax=viral metagenome TaxID=1070528 RepID=A0A6M3KXM3_9ZZZZ